MPAITCHYVFVPETIGQRLLHARQDRGLYQRQVADAVGCRRSTIAEYEKLGETVDRSQRGITYLPAVAEFLGVTLPSAAGSKPAEVTTLRIDEDPPLSKATALQLATTLAELLRLSDERTEPDIPDEPHEDYTEQSIDGDQGPAGGVEQG